MVRAADAIEHYKAQILRVGLRGNASGSLAEAARQHLAISAAISRGDADSAALLSREHVEIAKRQYLARIQDAIDALDAATQAD